MVHSPPFATLNHHCPRFHHQQPGISSCSQWHSMVRLECSDVVGLSQALADGKVGYPGVGSFLVG